MAKKQITNDMFFGSDARSVILKGVEKLEKAVAATLGPSGKNVVISRGKASPLITKDGVTVARSIYLKDEMERLGAQMVQEVAGRTNDTAGDGTTTATILAKSIFKSGLKLVAAGYNPISLKRELDILVDKAVEELKKIAKPIRTPKEVEQVAIISTNGDTELGGTIAAAVNKVGEKGSVLIEQSSNEETKLKFVEGMVIERGVWMREFVNNYARLEVNFDNPRFLIINNKVDNPQDLVPALEDSVREKYPLVIAVDEIEDSVVMFLAANKLKNNVRVALMATPGYGETKYDACHDFAAKVGAQVYNEDYNPIGNYNMDGLGTCDRVIMTGIDTTIVGGKDVSERVEELKVTAEACGDAKEAERIQQRINYLTNAIAVIQLGAHSETELNDKKLRVEDALNATRAAISEGIVPGGGVALLRVFQYLDMGDSIAKQVLSEALLSPIRTLIGNSAESAESVIQNLQDKETNYGYNGAAQKYGDMIKMGVIDPVKVTRCALINANSVAGMMLTTDVAIVAEQEEV